MALTKEKKETMLTQMLGKDLEEKLAKEARGKQVQTLRKTSIKRLQEWGADEKQARLDQNAEEERIGLERYAKLEAAFIKWLKTFLPAQIVAHCRDSRITHNPAEGGARAQITFQLPKHSPILLSFEPVVDFSSELQLAYHEHKDDSQWLEGVFRTRWGFARQRIELASKGDAKPPFVFYSGPYAWTEAEGDEAIGWKHKYKAHSLIDAIQKAGEVWPALKVARKELDEYLKQKDKPEVATAEVVPDPTPPTGKDRFLDGIYEMMDTQIERHLDQHYHEFHEGGPFHD